MGWNHFPVHTVARLLWTLTWGVSPLADRASLEKGSAGQGRGPEEPRNVGGPLFSFPKNKYTASRSPPHNSLADTTRAEAAREATRSLILTTAYYLYLDLQSDITLAQPDLTSTGAGRNILTPPRFP